MNRFEAREPKQAFSEEVEKKTQEKKEKYIVNVRFSGEIEDEIREAARRSGLPVTKYIELAVRRQLKEDRRQLKEDGLL